MAFMSSSMLLGGGVAAMLVGFWGKIKSYMLRFYGLFVVRIKVQGTTSVCALSRLLWTEFRYARLSERLFRGTTEFVRPNKRNELVMFEMLSRESTVFWRNRKPITVKGDPWGSNYQLEMSFFRWTFDADALLQEAVAKFNVQADVEESRFFIKKMQGSIGSKSDIVSLMMSRGNKDDGGKGPPVLSSDRPSKHNARPVGWSADELGIPRQDNPLERLALPEKAQDAIDEASWWLKNEEWFKDRFIPWKRGWLCYGASGTGKTAFIRAIAQHLDLPMFVFDTTTMNNADFVEKWGEMMEKTPCMAVFEDFDATFHGRENIVKTGDEAALTFSCFLNCLDGVENTDGILVVVTTNHIDLLDEAIGLGNGDDISTRPGRIDRAIEFVPINADGRWKIARRILGDYDEVLWDSVIKEGTGDTGARFQERCCRIVKKLIEDDVNVERVEVKW